MKKLLLSCTIACIALISTAQSVSELIAQGKRLEVEMHEASALFKYKAALKQDPNNYFALCRASYLYCTVGYRVQEMSKKKEYFNTGMAYAEKALKINPNDAESNYVMGLAKGRIAQLSPPKVRVAMLDEIAKYSKRALQLNPKHVFANQLLGRLHYRTANASAVERAAANLLFGGLPKGYSNEQAAALYIRSMSADPSYILARRDLALTFIKLKQRDKAIAHLEKVILLKPKFEDDPEYLQSARLILAKLKKKN